MHHRQKCYRLATEAPQNGGQDLCAVTCVVPTHQNADKNGSRQHEEDVLHVAPQGVAHSHVASPLPGRSFHVVLNFTTLYKIPLNCAALCCIRRPLGGVLDNVGSFNLPF